MGQYFGFTKSEVQELSVRHGMDFEELEKWYDGYQIGNVGHVFNPNSVMQAIRNEWCDSYWNRTGSYDTVSHYIQMNFDGLKDDIIKMMAGGRCSVNPAHFKNDLSEIYSKDDALTVLIHLGYLSYDRVRKECYIPNTEVAGEFVYAVEDIRWAYVAEAIKKSERLLEDTFRGNAEAVARGIDAAHDENTSILSYNDENSLACVISIAYYYAQNEYHVHREYQTGKGFADLVLIPRNNVARPAIIIELKKDQAVQTGLDQIKERNYPQKVAEYTGDILLVAINYDTQTKQHTCKIERWEKQ
jgi:hypothetical protein